MSATKLTPARARGLRALAVTGTSRISNRTSMGSANDPQRRTYVYWQTARWLVANGLANWYPPFAAERAEGIEITERGRRSLA